MKLRLAKVVLALFAVSVVTFLVAAPFFAPDVLVLYAAVGGGLLLAWAIIVVIEDGWNVREAAYNALTPAADGPQSRSRDGGSSEGEGVNVPDSEAVRPLGKMSGHANRTPRQHDECSGADQERGS